LFFLCPTSDSKGGEAGLRAVAIFEASKGAVALLAASGLLVLWHADAQSVGDALARHLHLNPGRQHAGVLWSAIQGAEAHLRLLAFGVLVYAGGRFTEAFGLWNQRAWAEWFGVVSGAVYVPLDLIELVRQPGLLSLSMLTLNLLVVGYLARQLRPFRNRSGAGEPG
jgi:uncharacterized membrane protein (DUF2068 family)